MIHHKKRAILYVDDTVEQRYAMRRILELEGFPVVEAGTGKEALASMSSSLALAVVDVRLPDISGYELSKKLKAIDPQMPILQVSASFSDPGLRAAGLSGGADAYIAQPVHPAELVALIRRMLRTSEAEESLRFLAAIGTTLSSSLSIEETVRNIQRAMVPKFADECSVLVDSPVSETATYWAKDSSETSRTRQQLDAQGRDTGVKMLDGRHIVASLVTGSASFGAILFTLEPDREYTTSDIALAADLSNRAALALQNCLLFASEKSTREALIQSEKLATAGRMSAAMAHEINNPLEALTNLIYIIEQSPDVPAEMQEIASAALAEVGRLAHIARQSLGFYRELRAPSRLDLAASVRDTVELYGRRLQGSGIEVVLNLQDGVWVKGIQGEVRQVISNLLVNALEATVDGGKVEIETSSDGRNAHIVIRDHGVGISESIRAKVFEPFFTTKQGTGTGLGLWITQSIVEKHGGTIGLEATNGTKAGTAFLIELPLDTDESGARQ